MRNLDVVGIRIDAGTGAPVLLLRDEESGRFIPIWIGPGEAAAIASALEGVVPDRPMTHDLFATALVELGHPDVLVEILGVDDGVFYADLTIGEVTISARPSDAVALAVRLGASVVCPAELVAEVGIELDEEAQDEVEAFKEFLDTVSADDFKDPNA